MKFGSEICLTIYSCASRPIARGAMTRGDAGAQCTSPICRRAALPICRYESDCGLLPAANLKQGRRGSTAPSLQKIKALESSAEKTRNSLNGQPRKLRLASDIRTGAFAPCKVRFVYRLIRNFRFDQLFEIYE